MYQYNGIDDTITAISTPVGQGGIGIVRLSGKDALAICDKLFRGKSKSAPSTLPSYRVRYGWIYDGEQPVDEVLLTVMRCPRSYTAEDVAEISCHGGTASLKAILQLCIDQGARLAEPGEFTKRAFLNGRIDLAQAEAVLDLINAKTSSFLQVSTHQLAGTLSKELAAIRESLMSSYIELEAVVNFPEDDIDASSREKIISHLQSAHQRVKDLLDSSEHGRILKEGIKIVLCGKPNAGKSSLLNELLKVERAIVSNIAGTTRDTIEETAQIQGIPFQLVDTAGIIEPRDLIEEEAVKRSHLYIQGADLVLFVVDGSEPLNAKDKELIDAVKGQNVIVVINKADLPIKADEAMLRKEFPSAKMVSISATQKSGLNDLEKEIVESVWHEKTVDTHGVMISNIRHIEALKKCQAALSRSCGLFHDGVSFEFISEEIKLGVNCLDSITGKNIDADLLDNIFSQFCIGK